MVAYRHTAARVRDCSVRLKRGSTVPHADDSIDWERIIRDTIRDTIARNTETAPTEPGLYRMPCGECYVDFFITADGAERWLVPGDERTYTRDNVAIFRHGDYPWERMFTLPHAAREIQRRAAAAGSTPTELLTQLVAIADAADAAEEEEIAQIVRERTAAGESTPLEDLARQLGVDLDLDLDLDED